MSNPATTKPPASANTIRLPEPIGLQPHWLDFDGSRQVLRVGRRGSKTRYAFIAALTGRGPGWREHTPTFPGILTKPGGGDVVWLAQTYGNLSDVLWREEIVPRLGHLPFVNLNVQRHDVDFRGIGSLMLRSADRAAIAAIRGIGKRLLAVIIDEAAWLDLRTALQDVILLALADNRGWLLLMSTTNAGADGGYSDEGQPQVPSYFNVLCQQIRRGERGPEWGEFQGTAFDNPAIASAAIDELIAEYPEGSPKLRQEVYAELLEAGQGRALPQVSAAQHLVAPFEIPRHWTHFAAHDWGYNHPWVYLHAVADEDGGVYVVDTLWGRQDEPDEIIRQVAVFLGGVTVSAVHAGADIGQHKGRAAGFQGPTIRERYALAGWPIVVARDERVMGLDNLRRYVEWQPTVTRPDPITPRVRLFDTPGNRRVLAQLEALQVDPKNPEDALKVDADYAGRGGDDGYDAMRYLLMSRPLAARAAPLATQKLADRALPYDFEKREFVKAPIPTLDEVIAQESGATGRGHRVPRW